MPVFHAMGQHRCRPAEHIADPPVIDCLPAGLMASAQERVRRAAEADTGCVRCCDQGAAFFERDRQRLFGIDVLSRIDDRAADLGMGKRDGDVDDDLDLIVGQQSLDRHRLDAIGLSFGRGGIGIDIGNRFDGDQIGAGSTP